MFDTVNERYQRAIADVEDEKFIMEDVTGNPVIDDTDASDAAAEAAAEEEVDVYSVPRKDLEQMDKLAEKLVTSPDYDDDDLDDLLDADYEDDEIVVAESAYDSDVPDVSWLVEDCISAAKAVKYHNEKLNEAIAALNEINTGAIQSIKAAFSEDLKAARTFMKTAKAQLASGDNDKALESYNSAIKALKSGRKEAEKIDDDGLLEHLLISGVMMMIPVVGQLAYFAGYFLNWYNLRKQSDKGDTYSNKHKDRKKNLALEFLFGAGTGIRSAGASRSTLLAGYDKLIAECEKMRSAIKNPKNDASDVNESAVNTPSDDKVGSYNDGIQSGKVNYSSSDCEDRGGVGVNPVVSRNNQLSEAVCVDESAIMEAVSMLLDEAEDAAQEGNEEKKASFTSRAGSTIKKAVDFVIDKLRKLGALIVSAFIKGGQKLKKLMDSIIAKHDARELGMVRIVKSIYDDAAIREIDKKVNNISRMTQTFMNDRETDSDYGIGSNADSINISNERAAVPFNEANNLINKFNTSQAKQYEKFVNQLSKIAATIGKRADRETDSAKMKQLQSVIKAINAAIADLNKVTMIHQRNMNAAAEATKKYAKSAEDLGEKMGQGREAKDSNKAYNKRAKAAAKEADKMHESVEIGYVDEATGEYVFGFEIDEAAVGSDTGKNKEPKDCPKGKSDTYEEFKEDAKDSGTRDVKPLDTPKKPTSDLSDRDPKQPGLGNEVAMAKNTIAKAYTAEQLQSIPASELPKVRKCVTDILATKGEAIKTLKESYESHIGDSYEVRAAILEDASRARIDYDNLSNTLSIIESIMNNIDEKAKDVFSLTEDSEADLADLDLGDDDKSDDKDKKDKDEGKSDKKDDKKSDDSDDSKDDKDSKKDSECKDDECDDKDKKDDKKDKECKDDECDDKSDKEDKSDSKDKDKKDDDKDDKKEEDSADLDIDEAALYAEIDALLSDLDV